MKRTIVFILFLLLCIAPGFAQYAYRITPVSALPASCNPANGSVVTLTTGISGIYRCGPALNTWSLVGIGGASSQLVINQGTLTASAPFLTHTATWNNGAVTFTGFFSNTTDTASNAASLLMNLQVSGGTRFSVSKTGNVLSTGNVTIASGGGFTWSGRSFAFSGADGRVNFTNNAITGFTRLTLGTETVEHPSVSVSAAVAGQTQGIIINRGDGTPQTFANLGAATNGSMIYCADCTIASPCAGGGNGAIAKRLNGVWVCN